MGDSELIARSKTHASSLRSEPKGNGNVRNPGAERDGKGRTIPEPRGAGDVVLGGCAIRQGAEQHGLGDLDDLVA